MIGANHPFQVRGLNARDEDGNEGCASCGRTRDAHPAAGQAGTWPGELIAPDGTRMVPGQQVIITQNPGSAPGGTEAAR